MDNCKTLEWESDIPLEQVSDDAKQIGYKLEWPSDEMIKECKEMLFEKDDKHIDYSKHITTDMRANNCKTLEGEKNMDPKLIANAENIDIAAINEIVKGKKATYETIKKEIRSRIINVPPMDAQYAKFWIDAYSACQNDILDLLERLEAFEIERYRADLGLHK